VKGFNGLMGANVKLGKWDEYLAMRQGILALNFRDGAGRLGPHAFEILPPPLQRRGGITLGKRVAM
jgi:hypothetical protein